MNNPVSHRYLVCIDNRNYPASLEVRKLYRTIPDPTAESRHYVRVIDESGEDYLYPEEMFYSIELPAPIEEALLRSL